LRSSTPEQCRTQFLVLGGVTLGFALTTAALAPMRVRVQTVTLAVSGVTSGVVVLSPAVEVLAANVATLVMVASVAALTCSVVNIAVGVYESRRYGKAEQKARRALLDAANGDDADAGLSVPMLEVTAPTAAPCGAVAVATTEGNRRSLAPAEGATKPASTTVSPLASPADGAGRNGRAALEEVGPRQNPLRLSLGQAPAAPAAGRPPL